MSDIYVHSSVLENYTPRPWYDCEYGMVVKELIHKNCGSDTLDSDEELNMADYIKAIYDHEKVCNK